MVIVDARRLQDCAAFGRPMINGKKMDGVFYVLALWNGGPALIGYYLYDARGRMFAAPDGDAASAWRFVRSARIAFPQ
jgi:hypothetical protein